MLIFKLKYIIWIL